LDRGVELDANREPAHQPATDTRVWVQEALAKLEETEREILMRLREL